MNELLKDAGEALYGPHWKPEIARVLDVDERTLRNWLSGKSRMPSGVALDLWRLCLERSADLDDVIERLKVAARPNGK